MHACRTTASPRLAPYPILYSPLLTSSTSQRIRTIAYHFASFPPPLCCFPPALHTVQKFYILALHITTWNDFISALPYNIIYTLATDCYCFAIKLDSTWLSHGRVLVKLSLNNAINFIMFAVNLLTSFVFFRFEISEEKVLVIFFLFF